MRKYLLFILWVVQFQLSFSQDIPVEFARQYALANNDRDKALVIIDHMSVIREDLNFLNKATSISRYFSQRNDMDAADFIQLYIYEFYAKTGDYVTGLKESLEILRRFEKRNNQYGILFSNTVVSICYYNAHDKERTLAYDRKAVQLAIELKDPRFLANSYNNLAADLIEYGYHDSGMVYLGPAIKYAIIANDKRMLSAVYSTQGNVFLMKKQYENALQSAWLGLSYGISSNLLGAAWSSNDIAQIYLETGRYDSAMFYAREAIRFSLVRGFKDQLTRGYEYLSFCFEKIGKTDSSLKYSRLRADTKDSLITSQKTKEVQSIANREQIRLQESEQERLKYQNKVRVYAMLAAVLVFLLIALILFRNNKQKQKVNKKLEKTLSDLQETQAQLIQSEKMASLGELTAGIAHEIQNPLNFVNNFSEINRELLAELNDEITSKNYDNARDILVSLVENEEKISHHGKRAAGIVKGMLQHSRAGSGTKEPTDINALADECLRLAYHGLRAKDKSFNAILHHEYDNTIGKISIIPQDIGRVILNLLTNAFYAVTEKHKLLTTGYEPTVSLKTFKFISEQGNKVIISVSDNGNGIPPEALQKIFQPFFTTKPTGQGTGLGLSMSYDIITKAHNGQLTVKTEKDIGTTFTILLPI